MIKTIERIYIQAIENHDYWYFQSGHINWALVSDLLNDFKVSPTTLFFDTYDHKLNTLWSLYP